MRFSQTSRASLTRQAFWVMAACASMLLFSGISRADQLDRELSRHMPQVMEYLHKHDYKNVGVLRFRVEEGSKKSNFSAGAINGNMVTRLENALIIHNQKGALGIIHDPGAVAARQKVGDWYNKETERKKLFAITDYPLAWGSQRVKVDAFLTGAIKLPADLSRTTVIIEAFDLRSPGQPVRVTSFSFDTDRNVLRDIGKNFSVARRGMAQPAKGSQLNQLILQSARKRDGENPTGDKLTPDNIAGIEFKLKAEGEPIAPIDPNSENSPWQLKCPAEGKPIVFTLKNNSDKRLAVRVKLNQSNLLGGENDDGDAGPKFVLDKGREYTLRGFYKDFDKDTRQVVPFKVLVGDEARALSDKLSDKAGLIEIDVFESGGDGDMEVTLRKALPGSSSAARRSLTDLTRNRLEAGRMKKREITESRDGKVVRREIIDRDENAIQQATESFKVVDFGAPKSVGRLSIKIIKNEDGTSTDNP